MSVVKSMRAESTMTVIVKAGELATHTIKICSNEKYFPKHYRWCITNKIVEAAVDINRYATLANAVYVTDRHDFELRKQYQTQAIATSYSLLSMMDIAYRLFNIESSKIEYWTGLVIDVQNLLRKWRSSDIERFSNLQ